MSLSPIPSDHPVKGANAALFLKYKEPIVKAIDLLANQQILNEIYQPVTNFNELKDKINNLPDSVDGLTKYLELASEVSRQNIKMGSTHLNEQAKKSITNPEMFAPDKGYQKLSNTVKAFINNPESISNDFVEAQAMVLIDRALTGLFDEYLESNQYEQAKKIFLSAPTKTANQMGVRLAQFQSDLNTPEALEEINRLRTLSTANRPSTLSAAIQEEITAKLKNAIEKQESNKASSSKQEFKESHSLPFEPKTKDIPQEKSTPLATKKDKIDSSISDQLGLGTESGREEVKKILKDLYGSEKTKAVQKLIQSYLDLQTDAGRQEAKSLAEMLFGTEKQTVWLKLIRIYFDLGKETDLKEASKLTIQLNYGDRAKINKELFQKFLTLKTADGRIEAEKILKDLSYTERDEMRDLLFKDCLENGHLDLAQALIKTSSFKRKAEMTNEYDRKKAKTSIGS